MKIPFTKEPGSWVMFGIAFVTGAAKANEISCMTFVILVSLSLLLMAKAPLSILLKRRDRDIVLPLTGYILIGSAGCLYSIIKQPQLIALYAAGAILVSLYFTLGRKDFPVLSEASGMAIMGLAAAIAASAGNDISSKLYLWPVFFLFYLASSFRVRFAMMRYRIISGIYSGILIVASGIMAYAGRLVFLSFLPLAEDIYSAITGRKEDFKRLGIIETIKSVIFGLILISIKD